MADVPGFPFTPGSAREVREPLAEAERLAKARKAAEVVTVPRGDFAVLVALASVAVALLADSDAVELPSGVTAADVARTLERYADC